LGYAGKGECIHTGASCHYWTFYGTGTKASGKANAWVTNRFFSDTGVHVLEYTENLNFYNDTQGLAQKL
jgi:hypothetical protein